MRLTRVRAWNFKSFRELDIRLDPLNIVIGANASGKSNFVALFQFLRDIVESGLDNAVQMQGGPLYLRNMNCGDQSLTIELSTETGVRGPGTGSEPSQSKYRFSLALDRGQKASVVEDEIHRPSFSVTRGDAGYHFEGQDHVARTFVEMMNSRQQADERLLLETLVGYTHPFGGVRSIGVYDIDPKAPKTGVRAGKSDLEPNAGNLAIALERILSDSDHRRDLLNLLKHALPFARDLQTQREADGTLLFHLREKFSEAAIPAEFLSDGTIDVLALLAILYFERKSLVIIEELERNLHPSLVATFVDLLKEASANRQILVTTHNPEVVRYADPDQLLLISRDEAGCSHAVRPVDSDQVKKFLADDLTVHELYLTNLLEV